MDLEAARDLATTLMHRHGLGDWAFDFDRARTRAGSCRYARRAITLSRPLTLLHEPDVVRDTVLHEIGHALTGPGHGHDAEWRRVVTGLGGSPARCLPADAPQLPARWVGTCPAGHERRAHRRPTRVSSCPVCSPAFDPDAVYTWTRDGGPVDLGPAYEEELAAARAPGVAADPPAARLAPGHPVVLLGQGRYAGMHGTVVSRGRTRYRVRTGSGTVTAPFALVRSLAPAAVAGR